jgi:phosphatidylinositol alpha-1,6-mannosyltransferase
MTRILLLSDIFPPKTGGSGRWFWEIYSRLPREQVVVATGEDPASQPFDHSHDLNLHRLPLAMATRGLRPLRNLKRYIALAWRVRRFAKRERVDVIHAGRNLPEGFIAYLVRRMSAIPYLCYAHGEDIGVSSTSRELAWMTRCVLGRASGVIANSENTRSMLLNDWNVPAERIHLLHPGVDTRRFVPAARDESIREELGWHGRTVLLTVGRLQKRKGHDMLIRALPAIRGRHPNVHYAILGDGDERANLQSLAESLGVADRVQFLGQATDDQLLRCYQQCDLFVLPNRAVGRDVEGFGMVLLEAQACGKPVIAGASGGTAETMKIPETGRVVLCEEPEPLAAMLIEMLRDPAALNEMGRVGREWVCGQFDWEALGRQAEKILAKALENG